MTKTFRDKVLAGGQSVAAVGYNRLVPARLPGGYRPAEVAVGTYPRPMPLPSPLAAGFYRYRAEHGLGRGTLSGIEARLLSVRRNTPHLWACVESLEPRS